MSENVRPFPWTGAKSRAATLLAEGRLTDAEIAADVGVTDRQLYRWKQHPEFGRRVERHVEELDKAAARRGIARRMQRVRRLDERWEKMHAVLAARAADPALAAAAGGATGLLVRQLKTVGSGPAAEVVEEFSVDTGLLREIREHEKQAAQELGQWSEKHEHAGQVEIVISVLGQGLSLEDL